MAIFFQYIEKNIYIILGGLILLFLIYKWLYYNNIEQFETGQKRVVLFYSSQCGHCGQLRGESTKCPANKPDKNSAWGRFFYQVKNHDVLEINVDETPVNDVDIYPTIKLFKGSDVYEYSGNRTYDDLVQFVENPTEHSFPH